MTQNTPNKGTQTGVTRGCQIEDNLYRLQHCIDSSFNDGVALIIASIDYTKAFDSVRRESIVKALMHYTILSAPTNTHTDNSTRITRGEMEKEMDTQSGIRHGCTGSTVLFKLTTYRIIQELEEKEKGFHNPLFNIKVLH